MWEKKLELYDEAVLNCPSFERKGKTMPYTSANGHMFSLLNKAGELGVRFSNDIQQKYIEDLSTTTFVSHGATIRGYVLMPEHICSDIDQLAKYLNEGYDYVMSLEPK